VNCERGLDYEGGRVVLGPLFLDFRSHSKPRFERSGIMC
jgi:hypothetical protein